MEGKKAGLICHCGSDEVYYGKKTHMGDYLFKCHECGSFGFRGAFKSEDDATDDEE